MNTYIRLIRAMEILDSRGLPTLRVFVQLDDGMVEAASVPSGASRGEHEALELRDTEDPRYGGRGVREAVFNVNEVIAPQLAGLDVRHQSQIDRLMIQLDGTASKAKLGANAILGVSQAVARSAARACGLPLYEYLGGVGARRLPMPMMNVINGGKHADSGLDFQEFMIVPVGAPTFGEALRYGSETFQALKVLLRERKLSTAVGDEGGFAPMLASHEEAVQLIILAIERAGLLPGEQIAVALDPAATSFFSDGEYRFSGSGQSRTADEMTKFYSKWVETYPIISIEDGLAESDWEGFRRLTAALGGRVQIVGDDNLCTNPIYIRRAIAERACNAALIKLNQIGTVTETIDAIRLCREAGWRFVISHRSGETEDTFMADFAVAMEGGQIKTGSLCRSERIAKYNRLLEIEAELGSAALFEA
ncbi:MAG TPA: phosphopyruvate hydratase [Steroidobacteraceae bacterium]|nr:phosphopyruvate hydratase [Steroidobacteraceae bacterium]